MRLTSRPTFWVTVLAGLAIALLPVALAGCAPKGPVEPIKSPRQIWIEAHPTHAGPSGECIEADNELCDDDPFDLDDMDEYDKHGYTKKPSPKATRPKATPRPATTRRR